MFGDCFIVYANCELVGLAFTVDQAFGLCDRFRIAEAAAANNPIVMSISASNVSKATSIGDSCWSSIMNEFFLPKDREPFKKAKLTIVKTQAAEYLK